MNPLVMRGKEALEIKDFTTACDKINSDLSNDTGDDDINTFLSTAVHSKYYSIKETGFIRVWKNLEKGIFLL